MDRQLTTEEMIFGSFSAGVTAWLARDMWRQYLKKDRVFSDFIEDRADVRDYINKILQRTKFGRVLVFRTTNGGGIPHIGSPIYIKCLFEDFDGDYFTSVKDELNRVEADEHCEKIITSLAKHKKVEVLTKSLEPGLLRDIYESQGVVMSIIYFLHQTKYEFYYMSVAVHRDRLGEIQNSDLLTAGLLAGQIAKLYQKIH